MRWRRPIRTLLAVVGGCIALAIVLPPLAGLLDAGASLALLGVVGVAVVRGAIWVDRLGRAARRVATSQVRRAPPTAGEAPERAGPRRRTPLEPAPPDRAGPPPRRRPPSPRVAPPDRRDDERAARWPAIAAAARTPAGPTPDGRGRPERA